MSAGNIDYSLAPAAQCATTQPTLLAEKAWRDMQAYSDACASSGSGQLLGADIASKLQNWTSDIDSDSVWKDSETAL